MPAPSTPIEELPVRQQRLLGDIARVAGAIAEHEAEVKSLYAERLALFRKADKAGIARVTVGRAAGLTGEAVNKALRSG